MIVLLGHIDHVFAQFVTGLVDARCVEKDELRVFVGTDAEKLIARRLGLVAGDRDLLAQKLVEEGRFSDVGPADDCDETAARLGLLLDGIVGQIFRILHTGGPRSRLPTRQVRDSEAVYALQL